MDPTKRILSDQALKDAYFQEEPFPCLEFVLGFNNFFLYLYIIDTGTWCFLSLVSVLFKSVLVLLVFMLYVAGSLTGGFQHKSLRQAD